MIDPGLDRKVVLVTGANHGIGAATARAFAAQGARVFLHYFRVPPEEHGLTEAELRQARAPGKALYRARQSCPADAVVDAIRTSGGIAEAWEADLADPATPALLFARAEAALGSVDILVNNAAYCTTDTFLPSEEHVDRSGGEAIYPMLAVTPKSIDDHFAVNARAVALLIAEFTRRHVAQGKRWGRVISVSTDGASGFTGSISYGASKHALESYSRAAADELGRFGITVNIVSLGPIQTGWITPEIEASAIAHTPLGRIGQPDDVADVIVFLASEQARWITGQLLYVGGGHQMAL
jgi:3-oxoacyl-[acyl-carrier protein] reductase